MEKVGFQLEMVERRAALMDDESDDSTDELVGHEIRICYNCT